MKSLSCVSLFETPWTEEPGGLQSMRSQGVGYDPATKHLTYMTTGKVIALSIQTIVSKVMSLLFNMLSRFVIAFLPKTKRFLITRLQSPSAVILEPKKIVCHCFHSPHLFAMK